MDQHTSQAIKAVEAAVTTEHDFGGWLANVLATVAAGLPDKANDLVDRRPGSWEAAHIVALAEGGVNLSPED